MTRRDRQARRQRRRRRFDPLQRANDFTVEPAPRTETLSVERRVDLLSNLAKNAILLAGKPPGRQLLETVLELPEPSQLDVGRQIILRSGAGIADRIYTGMQLDDDSFAWVEAITEISGATFSWVRNFAVAKAYFAACDTTGNVWVSRYTDHRVQKFTSSGTLLSTIGNGSTAGAAGWGQTETSTPAGVVYFPAGLRYPSERMLVAHQDGHSASFYGHDLYLESPKTYSGPYAGFLGTGQVSGVHGTAGGGTSSLNSPLGVAVDGSGYHYIVDSANNRVAKWLSTFNSSSYAKTDSQVLIIGSGANLNGPRDVVVDSAGNVYVSDVNNDRVQVYNASGTLIDTIGSSGSGNGQLNAPVGLAIDNNNNLHVVDNANSRVAVFKLDGTWVANYGAAGSGDGQLSNPFGIAINSSGVIFVCDFGNNRVSVWV